MSLAGICNCRDVDDQLHEARDADLAAGPALPGVRRPDDVRPALPALDVFAALRRLSSTARTEQRELWLRCRPDRGAMSSPCPATGGAHEWTDDVDERYSDPLSRYYLPRAERWHCIECHTPWPDREDNGS